MKHLLPSLVLAVLLAACVGADTMPANQDASSSQPASISFTDDSIVLSGVEILTIGGFADEIQVSPESAFGGSDWIKDAQLSPDGKLIAIVISGAAHEFGWLYDVQTQLLRPVVFQYGGGIDIDNWSEDSRYITFVKTTPQPATVNITIDTRDLPEYPRVP